MDEEIKQQLKEQSEKLDRVYELVEKARKYFLFIIWISVIGFLLPLLGLLFEIPKFIQAYTGSLGGY